MLRNIFAVVSHGATLAGSSAIAEWRDAGWEGWAAGVCGGGCVHALGVCDPPCAARHTRHELGRAAPASSGCGVCAVA